MEDNICKKCKRMVVMNAISFGKCKICNKDIYCAHTPCYKFCDECAKKSNQCKQCGECMDYISNNEVYPLCKNYDCEKYGKCCLSESMIDEGGYSIYEETQKYTPIEHEKKEREWHQQAIYEDIGKSILNDLIGIIQRQTEQEEINPEQKAILDTQLMELYRERQAFYHADNEVKSEMLKKFYDEYGLQVRKYHKNKKL